MEELIAQNPNIGSNSLYEENEGDIIYDENTKAKFIPRKRGKVLFPNPLDTPSYDLYSDPQIGLKIADALGYNYYIQLYLSGRHGKYYGNIDLEKFITRRRNSVIFRRGKDTFIIACFDTIEERDWAINHVNDCCTGMGAIEGVWGFFQGPS